MKTAHHELAGNERLVVLEGEVSRLQSFETQSATLKEENRVLQEKEQENINEVSSLKYKLETLRSSLCTNRGKKIFKKL